MDLARELRDAADLAVMGAGELIGEAASDALGPPKTVAKALWSARKIVRDRSEQARDPAGHAREHVASVVDEQIENLERIFDPARATYSGAPLVVLIDDAQFADEAEAADRYIERLIGRASRDRWPLLLVLTHWSRNLED